MYFAGRCVPSNRLSAEHRVCVVQQRVQEERQRQNHERIQLKGCDQVAVQQLVKPTRRATAWTGKTGQRAKWTTRKESRLAWLKHKKKIRRRRRWSAKARTRLSVD